MNPEEFIEYMNLLKPAVEAFAKKQNMSVEELMLRTITLEDTKLFNYKGKQSSVYNRFKDNKINTLKDLFDKYDNHTLKYGLNELNENFYIHDEIEGIITLLKFKYLGIIPEKLKELLNYEINFNFTINISPYSSYGYPGDVFKTVHSELFPYHNILLNVDSFYKVLKSCGFDQSATKALIDIAYEEKTSRTTLGEFLENLSIDKINEKFKRVPQELTPFLNILKIILDYHKEYNKTKPHTK